MATSLYSRADVQNHLDLAESLATVEKTYAEAARGRVLNPPKLTMHMGDDGEWPHLDAFAIDMPAYVDWLDSAGMKWAVAAWDADAENPISSRILLFDVARGAFTAVMEGMYLTGVRTALQSVVGLEHLCPDTPASVGLIGAGFQAEFQVSVIDRLTDVEEFRVFDIDAERARRFASDLDPGTTADVVLADTAAEAASRDAVITVTDSKTPVVEASWLEESGFLVALGSYRELPDHAIHSVDHLIVDQVDQCLQRGALADLAGRGEVGEHDVDATIGEVVTAEYSTGIDRSDRVLFVPIGMGALDIALAERVRRTAAAGDGVDEFAFV